VSDNGKLLFVFAVALISP